MGNGTDLESWLSPHREGGKPLTDPDWAVVGEQGPEPQLVPRLSRGGIIRSRSGDWDHRSGDQVLVPVGMSDLLDDWLWSPDAARWTPEEPVSGVDRVVQQLGHHLGAPGSVEDPAPSRCNAYFVPADVEVLQDALRPLVEEVSRLVATYEALPVTVREQAERLSQNRNTPHSLRFWLGRWA